ncbi:ubiquitin-conjugating enzyme/RWD-like protein [Calycina marina]|uniref:Ubiquitin-conjugating enzyme E2 2 n=1 Tax=Calycina marina TaxID=1763456 RepID=A0A9P7Z8U6_9HELO|nr:ubiquitin-conjugating enzyme/RWD-like protein [Calycina marina]
MASNRIRRVAKELADIHSDTQSQILVRSEGDGSDISRLRATFPGPPDTPYEGGTYEINVKIPAEYPFRPPQMVFKTKIWHPNVSSQTGVICLDTLDKAWSPVLTIKAALLSVQSLLNSPEAKDPQDAVVASMLQNHPEEFARKAREWAINHAGAPAFSSWQPNAQYAASTAKPAVSKTKEEEAKLYQGYHKDVIGQFVSMGFPVEAVVDAFKFFAIDRNGGNYYVIEEAYGGDVLARLLGEA